MSPKVGIWNMIIWLSCFNSVTTEWPTVPYSSIICATSKLDSIFFAIVTAKLKAFFPSHKNPGKHSFNDRSWLYLCYLVYSLCSPILTQHPIPQLQDIESITVESTTVLSKESLKDNFAIYSWSICTFKLPAVPKSIYKEFWRMWSMLFSFNNLIAMWNRTSVGLIFPR